MPTGADGPVGYGASRGFGEAADHRADGPEPFCPADPIPTTRTVGAGAIPLCGPAVAPTKSAQLLEG